MRSFQLSDKVSVRTRDCFMRALIDAASSSGVPFVRSGHPAIVHLQQRDDFMRVMTVLEGLGFINLKTDDRWRFIRCNLTSKGMCYFEKRSDDSRAFWINNILLPVIVSVITTVASVYILPPLVEKVSLLLSGLSGSK